MSIQGAERAPRTTISMEAAPAASLRILYRTVLGRLLLRLLITRPITRLGGWYMKSRLSRRRIAPFIRENGIRMEEYEEASYRSYNDFFTRKIRAGMRPIDPDPAHLISPCDAKLSVFRLTEQTVLPVKGAPYTAEELLQDDALARRFANGWCFVFRLAVDDYHRYCFFDDGNGEACVRIPGAFHTVQPIATDRLPVFHRNAREYRLLHTAHFGDVVQMEVGALMVGKICNHEGKDIFSRGEEKGYFEFGGSTVLLLFQQDAVLPDEELCRNTEQRLETVVRQGERVGIVPQTP